MSILVTGGGGLLGSRIVRKLISRGNAVVSLDTNTEQTRLADLSSSNKLKLISCDVRELENLSAVLKSHHIERVIHLAAVLAPISEEKPSHGFSINIQGTANVFEASSRAKIKRVIYASSIAVFGDQTEYGSHSEVDENSLRNPYSLYGYAKLINEETARAYLQNTGLEACGLRVPAIFGHGRNTGRSSAISRLISESAIGQSTISDVAADQAAPIIYVDDAAECFVQVCLTEQIKHPIYCLPSYLVTVQNAVEAIRLEISHAEILFDEQAAHYKSILNVSSQRFENDFEYQLPDFTQRVIDQINEARRQKTLKRP